MTTRTWKYEADLLRVVDGDTIVCDIDQGMNHWSRNQYVRLAGINAPELHGDTKVAGEAAKQYLIAQLGTSSKLFLVTTEYNEYEKYGRVLAYVYTQDPLTPDVESINQVMLDAGQAVPYNP
jgi:endonuclease YncB( thermonuclease family)